MPSMNFSTPEIPANRWLNAGYSGWNGKAIIEDAAMTIQRSCDTPYLILFRVADEPFICLEPQSHPVNAHNMPEQPGLVLLRKEASVQMKMQIAIV